MSALFISIAFFCLVGAAGVALYVGVFAGHRAVDDRFADLAVKMRVTQGALDGASEYDPNLLRMIFKWASKKVPAPDLDSPKGEKLAQTLAQAGFLKSAAPHLYQVVRVLMAAGCGALGLLVGAVLHDSVSQPFLFGLGGVAIGIFVPSYYIGRRARARQGNIARQLSDVLDLLVVCVEAGLGLYEAIRIVGTECERQGQEIGTESAWSRAIYPPARRWAERCAPLLIGPRWTISSRWRRPLSRASNWARKLDPRFMRVPTRCARDAGCAPRSRRRRPRSKFYFHWCSSSCPR